ncbi:MAG: beta-galactosidase [Planctomycetia bacterium]|nr:beta-galactosidase [Planctomycetia bacterium]
MKTLRRMTVLLLAWILLTLSLVPISWTPWADDVRAMVQKARAAKAARMQPPQEVPGDAKPQPKKRKAPKPADFSWKAWAEIRVFLLYTFIPCFLTILLLQKPWRKRKRALLLLFPLFLGNIPVDGAESVRVQTIQGVPQIVVDGKPVRSRMFWGGMGTAPLLCQKEYQEYTWTFQPLLDAEGSGTLHFRFGTQPGKIYIDNIAIQELETGKWVVGPYSFEKESDFSASWGAWNREYKKIPIASVAVEPAYGVEGSSALAIEIFPQKEILPTDFHLHHHKNLTFRKDKTYRISFWMRGDSPRDVRVQVYRAGTPYMPLMGTSASKGVLESQIHLAQEADVSFISFPLPSVWKDADGNQDWKMVDTYVEKILKENPHALLIPRISMNAPDWWKERNPEELMVWKGISSQSEGGRTSQASVASWKYREAAVETLAATIRHLEEKFGHSIAGYHPGGQNTSEWFTYGSWMKGRAWYGKADERAWRAWLKTTYPNDSALQNAWGNSEVTLDTATVPSLELWEEAARIPLLNPETEKKFRPIVDCHVFIQKQMADTILALGKTIRKETAGKKLSVFFYGYSFELATIPHGPGYSAHYALRQVLDSPDVDILCSPMSYSDRRPGGSGACMVPAESVALAGKMYLEEDDTRTHRVMGGHFPGWDSGAATPEGTCELLLRNTGQCALRNFGTWWMDLGSSGWFNDERLWQVMRDLKAVDEYFLQNPTPYMPEVGIFVDETAALRFAHGRFTQNMLGRIREPLGRAGTSYGQYLLDDLLEGRLTPPKLCVIPLAACFSDAQKEAIRRAAGKSVILWVTQEGLRLEELLQAVEEAGVHRFTDRPCNVWANGPYILLHGAEDGILTVTGKNPRGKLRNAITGEKISDSSQAEIHLPLGKTILLENLP